MSEATAVRKGYKQTEVGVIPEDWEIKELGELLEKSRYIRYGIVQPGNFDSNGCLMLRSQDYSKGWVNPDDMHRVNSRLENQYRNARISAADLIMTIVGAGIGQVEVAPEWLDGAILSRSTARIAVDEIKASSRFVSACLESPIGKSQISDCQKEGAQPVVSCRDLTKFQVPFPPLSEQEAIAEALSDADALIESLEKLIVKKRQIKQGAMQELLTGKRRLPGFETKPGYKQTEVGVIPEDWTVYTLGGIGKFKNGLNKDNQAFGHGTPFVNLMDVFGVNSIGSAEKLGLVECSNFERSTYDLRHGDVLFVRSSVKPSGVGLTAFVAKGLPRTVYSGFLIRFRDGGFIDSSFKKHCFYEEGFRKRIISDSSVSANTNISQESLKKLPIALPPTKAEQEAIATILIDMDEEIEALEAKLAKVRQIKQGMMQELLTGRIRLI